MEQVLIYTILSIWAIFIGLTLVIVGNKAWREGVETRHLGRRRELEPTVLAYALGDQDALLPMFGDWVGRRDRLVIETVLLDHAQRLRGTIHRRLTGALDELGFVEAQLGRLRSRRWWHRADAAEKLALSGAEGVREPLADAMDDPSPEVRMRVAKALGSLGGRAAGRVLAHALRDPSRWLTIRIADVLAGAGPDVLDDLLAEYPNLPAHGRLAVLDIVARLRPLSAVPWLIDCLEDPLLDVRARACHGLGRIGNPSVATALNRAMDDPAWQVRAMAAKALGRAGRLDSIDALSVGLRDRQWWVRANSADALARMGAPGLEALENMLLYPDRYGRQQAVLALERAGVLDQKVGELAESETRADAARRFLIKVIEAGSIARLRTLAFEHPNETVRLALTQMLPVEAERDLS
jgi:HEAT repeat protein